MFIPHNIFSNQILLREDFLTTLLNFLLRSNKTFCVGEIVKQVKLSPK